jgi:hypothetical protein
MTYSTPLTTNLHEGFRASTVVYFLLMPPELSAETIANVYRELDPLEEKIRYSIRRLQRFISIKSCVEGKVALEQFLQDIPLNANVETYILDRRDMLHVTAQAESLLFMKKLGICATLFSKRPLLIDLCTRRDQLYRTLGRDTPDAGGNVVFCIHNQLDPKGSLC